MEMIEFLPEPLLQFGHGQTAANPKAGLFFHGPLDERTRPRHIKIGVVGTPEGLRLYRNWTKAINAFIDAPKNASMNHVPFAGLNAVFGTSISSEPELHVELSETKLAAAIRLGKRHEAIKQTAALYEEAIRRQLDEDAAVDVWYVVIPDDIYRYGRPQSTVPKEEAIASNLLVSRKKAATILAGAPSLFPEENADAETFQFEPNFHHQLKARLLDTMGVVIQILRESTLGAIVSKGSDASRRRMQDPASIAWNLTTTLFYKAGGHPWKLAYVRPRVCYIGLVFKLFPDSTDRNRKACCGAQMFLENGEGLVFRGTPGNWYNPVTKQYHLPEAEAKALVERVIAKYKENDKDGLPPDELFIHGKTRFTQDEWKGFQQGAPGTKVSAIRVSEASDIRLYATRKTPVLRGTFMRLSDRRGLLWTRGFIPELGTYPGREVPRPLAVEVVHGDVQLTTVMQDLLMLSKLNFNACIFADGLPVTLRFADAVGEIITALPEKHSASPSVPLPFKRYI